MERHEIMACINEGFQKNINGDIKGLRKMMENHILTHEIRDNEIMEFHKRVEPVIVAYEQEKIFNDGVKKIGNRTIFWAKILGAIGIIVLAIQEFFRIVK